MRGVESLPQGPLAAIPGCGSSTHAGGMVIAASDAHRQRGGIVGQVCLEYGTGLQLPTRIGIVLMRLPIGPGSGCCRRRRRCPHAMRAQRRLHAAGQRGYRKDRKPK